MIFKVHMLAFREGDIRNVNVPDDELNQGNDLDRIFYHGQNDFQPLPLPSVSVGDVIEYKDGLHMVNSIGFQQITQQQFETYKNIPRRDRMLWVWDLTEESNA